MSVIKTVSLKDGQGQKTTYDIGALAQNVVYSNANNTTVTVKDKIDGYENIIPSGATTSNKLATANDIPGVATASTVGLMKPDGTTTTIDANGVLSASVISTLSALTDTAITNPANGQILEYNSTNGKWENKEKEIYFEQTATLSTTAATTVTFTNTAILSTSLIDIAVSEWGLIPDDVTVTTGVCTVIMPKVTSAHSVAIRIYVR